jgi:hypothetical protein
MKFLATLFSLFDKLLAYINTQQLKKAGKDELRVEQNEALQEKKKIADAIDASNPDDSFLLRPEERGRRL